MDIDMREQEMSLEGWHNTDSWDELKMVREDVYFVFYRLLYRANWWVGFKESTDAPWFDRIPLWSVIDLP